MSQLSSLSQAASKATFPKSSRLLKRRDFKFNRYRKVKNKHFHILIGEQGSGRLGISISKKVLKRSVWRNRIRRLIKEAFRMEASLPKNIDLHFIAQPKLLEDWETLNLEEIRKVIRLI